ncbi:MAG TPA: hypothetical protein VGB68_13610, partial [Pyrinomonadaceae bacterium]
IEYPGRQGYFYLSGIEIKSFGYLIPTPTAEETIMIQTVLTFITRVNPDKRARLEEILEQVRQNLDDNSYIPFASLTKLHFAGFVIFDDDAYGPYLVFENNFDGSLDAHLDELIRYAGAGLHQIYDCCQEYAGGSYEAPELAAYMRARVVRPSAYHIGNVGRSAARIKQESSLRDRIQDFFDELIAAGKGKEAPGSLHKYVQQFVRDDSSLAWACGDIAPRQTTAERILPWIKIAAVALGAIILLPVLIPAAIVWVIVLRIMENRDSKIPQTATSSHIRKLNEQEDRIVQNHLASITLVKPGWFRRWTLRIVLWLANLIARTSNKGELRGIPTIHFAHWSLIDKGRRLLFLSNYDGSWMSYLDDFIDKASIGLTGVWSNTVGFPAAKFLVFEGAQNEAGFKSFSRDSQTPAIVWYSAYPDLTVQNIDNDSSIREDLFTTPDETAAKNWLRLF